MRKFSTVLSGKGLLAASVATLAAGPALAEVAGRASFVTGNVSVTGKDGSVRELRRGDAINTGDRISTNTGRLQIRFSDGGFVSLQPGTVFGIDEYLYANRKPEETSLFFNLIQGGMRTVTGAIGKVNKQSYKVRTPVATIGIRGTGYRAQIMRNGGLLVSVGSGFVNVANRMGDTTAGSGQNIAVPDENTAPGLTDEQVDIAATGTNGEQPGGGEGGQDDGNPSSGNLLAQEFGAVEDPSQLPGFTPVEPPAPKATTIASPYNYYPAAADAVFIGSQLISADDDGSPIFERGTLKTVNTGSWGNLRWGVFTDGAWSTNSLFGYEGSSLSATQFLPYIFTNETTNTLSLPYTDGSASYSLQGKSAAYSDNGKTGTLNNLALTVHFADMTLDALLSVTLDGRTYSGSGTNLSTYSYGPANSFSTNLSTTGTGCNVSFGCYTDISGFFTGDQGKNGNGQIGASYLIRNTVDGNIGGVAALARTGYTPPPPPPTLVQALLTSYGLGAGAQTILGAFSSGALVQAQHPVTPGTDTFAAGTLVTIDKGSVGNLNWGAFTGGTSGTNTLFDNYSNPLALGANDLLPYLFGSPVTLGYGSGTASYSLRGGSAYTYAGGGVTAGTLNHFNLSFNFGSWTLDADMQVTAAGGTVYTASGTGLAGNGNVANAIFNGISLATSGGSCTGPSAGCYTLVSGFFSGSLNSQVGVSYGMFGMDGGSTAIKGVAALGKDSYVAPGVSLPDSTGFDYAVLACNDGYCFEPAVIKAYFDQNGLTSGAVGTLLSAEYDTGNAIEPYFARGTLSPVDITTQNGLNWGEFTNGSTSVGNLFGGDPDVTVPNSTYVPYIIGQMSAHGFLTGRASYTYQGGTAPRSTLGGTGTLNAFNLTFDFDFNSVDAAFEVAMGSNTYNVVTQGPRGLSYLDDGGRFALYNESFLVNGAACGSGAPCALIGGFFAGTGGNQIGVSYEISGTADGDITGVAALGSPTVIAGPSPTPVARNGYSIITSDTVNGTSYPIGQPLTYPDYDGSLTNTYDGSGALLQAVGDGETGGLLRNSALADSVGRNGNLDWGRWYGNGVTISGFYSSSTTLNTNQSLHYVTGPMSRGGTLDDIVAAFGAGVSATYNLAGGTTATSSDGRTGTLSGSLVVTHNMGTTDIAADLALAMSSGNSYAMSGNLGLANYVSYFGGNLACTGPSNGCTATVTGFFAGQQAQQVGLGYQVTDSDTTSITNGAAAFNRSTGLGL